LRLAIHKPSRPVARSKAPAACHPDIAQPMPDAASPAMSGMAMGMAQQAAQAAATPKTAKTFFMFVLSKQRGLPRYTEL